MILLRWLRAWLRRDPAQPADDFEPYCTEAVLRQRITEPLPDGTRKAIRKIAARYGAEVAR